MPVWIVASIFAAFMQNLRFLLQRHLKVTTLSTGGATWARFLYSAPLVAVLVLVYAGASGQGWPGTNARFWGFVVTGGLAQMLATACVVALFARRNFTVGITLKKTEVILTAGFGLLILGEAVSAPVLVAIVVGFVGVLLLSDPPKGAVPLRWRARIFNAASGYGLASGVLFGISAVGYRGASLALEAGDVMLRASFTLSAATAVQTLILGLWLFLREREEIGKVVASWRVSALVGLTSMAGSLGWFIAFTLQTAALVKAVGQVELVFTFLFSIFWLKERSSGKEIAGIALILVSLGIIIAGTLL
ncbi:DMT family transporter [Alterinioella nitratireducens]|jgi:drug/metabolite transporter (DMT)-like permease|uniref:DMT family transporter n=2 Tax=Rhodobacterales TaxID=204455 RepID=UPI0015582999|nr:DMT family transporter [Alterinioella nitratireducens]NPD17990.1 EamA family transporter [Alterinioella nitratireducens]